MEPSLSTLLGASHLPQSYGCLSCAAGREAAVIRRMQEREPSVQALAAMRERHQTVNGVHSHVPDVMLPGYVFFKAPDSFDPLTSFRMTSVNRVLCSGRDEWRLQGSDLAFAKWLFTWNGMLGFSKAYKLNGRVFFESGPLKELEACVRRVEWRGNSAQVELQFDEQRFKVWLGFDRIDPPQALARASV